MALTVAVGASRDLPVAAGMPSVNRHAPVLHCARVQSTTPSLDQRGVIRIAPSRRIVSPLSIGFSRICTAVMANSSGLPSRAGCGTDVPSAVFACRPGALPELRWRAQDHRGDP